MKTDFIIVYICCASRKEAAALAGLLLGKKLVACANIIPGIDSRFWWKGRIEKAGEALLIMKTRIKNFKEMEKEAKRVHSYDVPEIIALPLIAGSKDYLNWIKKSVK